MRLVENLMMAGVFVLCAVIMFFFISKLCDIIEDSVEEEVLDAAVSHRENKGRSASKQSGKREGKSFCSRVRLGFSKQPESHSERSEIRQGKPQVVHGAVHR